MSWWQSHGVRIRLTMWHLAAMIVVLAVYAAVIFTFVSRQASDSLDQSLRSDFWWAAALLDQTPEGQMTWGYEAETGQEEALWLQVWSPTGELLFANDEALRVPVAESRDFALRGADGIDSAAADDALLRMLTRTGSIGIFDQLGPTPVVIQVGRSEAPVQARLGDLLFILVVGLPLAVAVAGVGGYTLARRALSPVERMTERARTITAERLSDRLPVANPEDEMGRLATVFNETLASLEASFLQMRQFTGDVSHELRTPLTAIRSVGEVGLREHRDEVAYRGIIGSMLEETDRLSSLVDRLLTLSRAETGEAHLSLEDVELGALAEEIAVHLAVLAEEKGQSIVVERAGAPHARVNRLVVRQAIINLVDNAIKFSPMGGRVRIRVADTLDGAAVEVIDSGLGIDPGSRHRIFDRFYRAGDAASDATGTGLGLSIAKSGVEANGGRLTLERSDEGGSAFRITLPGVEPAARRAAS